VHVFLNNHHVFKLMKGKSLRRHSLQEKTAASVLLKPFISSYEWCHTTDAPSAWAELHFSNVNNIHVHSMIPEDQKNMTSQWCSTGRLFTAATQALNTSCSNIKLMKGKAPRKHSLHEKTAASVLLKLVISSNEWCHTTDYNMAMFVVK